MRKSEFIFSVTFDDNNVPEIINWSASEAKGENSTKAIMLSFWDDQARNTLRLDFWTKQMMIEEMKLFYNQNLLSMADAFERATGDTQSATAMRNLANQIV